VKILLDIVVDAGIQATEPQRKKREQIAGKTAFIRSDLLLFLIS